MHRFSFKEPPFDVLTPLEREQLEQSVDILYFSVGEAIINPGQPVEQLYVVIKGLACELADHDEITAVFRSDDTFDSRALIKGSGSQRIVAHEETLLYAIPKAVVMQLIESNSLFAAFFFQSVSQKFSALAQRGGNRELQTLLTATVRDACVREPVCLPGDATLLDAALAMRTHKTKSILVQDGEQTGIFTASDCRDVIIDALPGDTLLRQRCRFQLITCDIDDYLFNALLVMTRHTIQRVVVTESGQPVGVLEQIDLLSYFSNHSHLIAQQLELAQSLDTLRGIARQMDKLVAILSGHGVKARELARLVQALNSKLFARTWELVAPAGLVANSCLVVMGSEGRGEQIIKTDQDNALIVRDGFESPALAEACSAFSQALADFGYPPCPGRIMVSNPDWVQPLAAMKDRLYRWVYLPDPEAQMKLAIFTDACAVAGDAALLADARQYLQNIMQDDASYFARFARAVEQFDTPLGIFSQLVTTAHSGRDTLDLKKGGIFPIVHGIRALALENGLSETNTFDRIQVLVRAEQLDADLGHDLAEALGFLLEQRLEHGLKALQLGQTPGNLIVPEQLSTLERDLLKDALAVVKRFKNMVRYHFKTGAF